MPCKSVQLKHDKIVMKVTKSEDFCLHAKGCVEENSAHAIPHGGTCIMLWGCFLSVWLERWMELEENMREAAKDMRKK